MIAVISGIADDNIFIHAMMPIHDMLERMPGEQLLKYVVVVFVAIPTSPDLSKAPIFLLGLQSHLTCALIPRL